MGHDAVIEVDGLAMSYGSTTVLRGVDFRVGRGEVVALLGPNGAGKSTTIEILEGFRAPSGGRVRVLGEDPLRAEEDWRSRIGVVLQSWRDHGRWRVRELLDLFARFYLPYGRRTFDVDELLEMVGLTAQAGARIRTLSGGQRRRLDVAIGIVGRPEMLFLDEPTAGFDPVVRREFHELVHKLTDLEGTTVLLTTHDLSEAERLADRVLILDGGVIAADDSPDELARRVARTSEVRWLQEGVRHVHATEDATAFVRDLLVTHTDGIAELEVTRADLEDTYLAMVHASGATREEGEPR
ncbi:ABC transporter ATP-binding protein [Protaetiibacter sp. SSC-01]|uniref:ABC transporter ATP-binding protein n=1 Tax=Protaetiibacter sp. SSC-01 TaxID=2759943 RepID=UPI001CA46920|nr:ABC transporter ATP-binding protein [Protaetiibacter sp. SSC-01]